MGRIFITRELPFDAVDRLRAEHAVDVWERPDPPPPEALRERAAGADALLTMLTERVDEALLDAAPRLRAIANMAVGTDNIDLEAAAARGIAVGNTPGVLTDTTADLAFALLLGVARRLPEGAAEVRDGRWGPWQPAHGLGADVAGATLGIVGRGRIGDAMARRGEGFGMEVVHSSRSSGIPLEELLERADFVSLHTPLTPATRHLIDAAALERMKPTAFLINTARGGVVDQAALREALIGGAIAGAGLDVTDPEPLPPDDPLLDAPNLLVVPHVGSATVRTRARMAAMAAENLLAALAGRPMPYPAT
ncbi:2-hydroxyacid dehydrogenase [Candidatus Solirubrobacter pratensis]|uniref:2-hydroxyacid dehydrogenase n=1 Tax=Candidatus Solirubrobacter pratensis TaxID=1298857 RepID=UPI000422C0B2|nr:D-glycerate dehydrogenase [Candidatus Solirubrobacter pratensis]